MAFATLLVVAIGVAFIAPIGHELRFILFPQDEGLLLVYPSQMLHGGVPNQSFESVYGVTNLWVIAGAFKIFGYTVAVERGVGIFYRAAILTCLVLLVWRHRGPVASLVAAAVCIVLFAGTLGLAAFAWIGALAFVALAFFLLDIGLKNRIKPLPIALSGVGFGFAVGSRLDMTLAIFLVIFVLFLTYRECLRWLLPGLVVGLIPALINLVQAGPPAVIRDQLINPIFVSGSSRRIPLSTLPWHELALLVLCGVVALACIVSGIALARKNRRDRTTVLLLSFGVFDIGIIPEALQRGDSLHLALVACFVLPSAAMLPMPRALTTTWIRTLGVFPLVIGVVVLYLAQSNFGTLYWSEIKLGTVGLPVHLVANQGRSVLVGSTQDQAALTAIVAHLDARARPRQRVFVGPLDLRMANYNDTFIYFLFPHLVPGSFYLEMNPGEANGKNSRLTSDLRRDNFLILTNRYDNLSDPDPATRVGPSAPNRVVRTDFHQIAREGPWRLYERNSALQSRPSDQRTSSLNLDPPPSPGFAE